MSEQMHEESLGGSDLGITSGAPVPEVVDPVLPEIDGTAWSVEDVLSMARLPEKTATLCLRSDLQGEFDALMAEFSTLVSPTGEVLDADEESSAGEESKEGRATFLAKRLEDLRREMHEATWSVTFRAKSSDDWATFQRLHKPKKDTDNHTDYYNRLIATTAVKPEISMEQVVKLRQALPPAAILMMVRTALVACTSSGVDVPKLPAFLRSLVDAVSEG